MSFRLSFTSVRWIALLFVVSIAARVEASISVTLAASPLSPQPLATTITWTANVTDSAGGAHEFQFSVAPNGGTPAIVRDYSTTKTFPWTPSTREGTFTISVVARNISTGSTASASAPFTVTPLLVNGHAAVNPTKHPLVAFFSTGSCQVPNSMRVRFTPVTTVPPGGITASMTTNAVACRFNAGAKNPDGTSMNFYIAGMYPNTTYNMHWETINPAGNTLHVGADYPFTTGSLPANLTFPITTVLTPAMGPTSTSAPILLHDYLPQGPGTADVPLATDLAGNILWYFPQPVSLLPRTDSGGKLLIIDIYRSDTPSPYLEILRETDLVGNPIIETNVARINEQLQALGRRQILQFHHEARRFPNGDIVVLGASELLVYDAQGGTPDDPVDVLGDQVIVLDKNLQLKWAWDAYDFLDLNRYANLHEVCQKNEKGCTLFFLANQANDWLHTNSVQLAPDGNLLVSIRHQDWVIKIDYENGAGDGHIIWRMGYQGDFTLLDPPTSPDCQTQDQKDAYQWFTHQHDANFQLNGNIMSVFDNGNLRVAKCDSNGNSRGYVISVDEVNRQATPILINDLGAYSTGLGTAELIAGSSNYHFELGLIRPGRFSRSTEIAPDGTVEFDMQAADVTTYRSYRMKNLYKPALQSGN